MAAQEKKPGKESKRGSGRKSGKDKPPDPEPYSSIATHPKAGAQIRRAKGFCGLIGFCGAALLSYEASVPFVQTIVRALIFGIVGYLLAWVVTVLVWRQWMLAELHASADEIQRRRAALAEQAAAAEKPAKGRRNGKA